MHKQAVSWSQYNDFQQGPAEVTTPSISAPDYVNHRKGIEQWLSKMEHQGTRKSSHTTSAAAAGHIGPDVPKVLHAELPAPAFVLMGLLSSPS